MKDSGKNIIYIGKAKALKNRVSQYFGSQNNHSVKVRRMVENVDDYDYILCDSEFEALVLECSLIKQHKPKYNILLKDDKGYSYIKVYEKGWKDFCVTHQRTDDDAKYIGPFMSSAGISQAVDDAKKIFSLPTCGKNFSKEAGKSRACLNYHIGACSAPCAGKISMQAHNAAVDEALSFILDGTGKTLEELKRKMEKCAEELEFEKAAKYRDRIKSLERINEKQKVFAANVEQQDVFALVSAGAEEGSKSCLAVLRFRDGRLFDNEQFIIDTPDDMPLARAELIRSFYSGKDYIPRRVTLDGECAEKELTEQYLRSISSHAVSLIIPQKGEQHSLVEMCRSNAAQKLALYLGRNGKTTAALDELATMLGLSSVPQYIESYDISHTSGSDNVAGMVVFKNGLPCKKMYKHFAVKGFTGQDDYASMAEVIDRRLNEYEKNKDSGEGFGILPDLILLDGGKGQVSAVMPVLASHNISVPLFGMVKDSHHRTRAITDDGKEISFTSKRAAFTLVGTIQEEVHRYAVGYHRQKHKKASISSSLLDIEGIGENRAKALLKKFKTIKAIKEATVEELAKVPGMSVTSAQSVFNVFHNQTENNQ